MQKEENLFKKHSSSVKNFLPLRRQKFKEDYFLLTVSEITLLSTCVGYVFRFEVVDMEDNDLDGFDDKNLMPLTCLTKWFSSEVEINFLITFVLILIIYFIFNIFIFQYEIEQISNYMQM